MQVEVLSETRQRFMGKTYYLCGKYFQRKGVRLHREVWREAHGDIRKATKSITLTQTVRTTSLRTLS